MKKHDTPMLDELENGPWPSFISGIKKLRDAHPEERINEMTNDLLGQLEHSYETRKGYWKRRHSKCLWLWWRYYTSFFRSGRRFP